MCTLKERREEEAAERKYHSDRVRNFGENLVRECFHPEFGQPVFQVTLPGVFYIEPFKLESEAHAFIKGFKKAQQLAEKQNNAAV